MKRYYRVMMGKTFFNNGVYYQVLGKGDKLFEVRIWKDDEDGEADPITISEEHFTEQELKVLIKEETGLNYEVEWEDDEDDRI